jgi:hypothetical protein
MAVETSWLIGSTKVPSTEITIAGGAFNFPAGYRYLYSPDAALSLVRALQDLLLAAGIAGALVWVGQDRKVRIQAAAGFTLIWPESLRSLFGFTGNLGGGNAIEVATNVSPLLWSPGRTETPQEAPFGCLGRSVYDTRFGTSPDGVQVADSHHTQVINTFSWTHVATSRFQTSSSLGGEFTVFFDRVLRHAYKFHHWRRIQEDTSSSAPVVWTTSLGPYGYRPTRGSITWDFQRSPGHERTNRFNQVSVDCLITPEWET